MMPNGFEWVVIVVMILGRVVPVIAIVLLIIVLWRHLRKNKREEETGEAAPVVPIEAPSNTPGVIGHAAASNDSAGPCTPLTSERAEAIERTLLEHGLTERERVIVMGIYAGKTHAALAEELFLSRSTVGTYCKRAYEKLGVADKDALVSYLDSIA